MGGKDGKLKTGTYPTLQWWEFEIENCYPGITKQVGSFQEIFGKRSDVQQHHA